MNQSLQAIKISLPICFKRVYVILKTNKVEKGFKIQLVIYRNYNVDKDEIFKSTSFEIIPDPLIKFI